MQSVSQPPPSPPPAGWYDDPSGPAGHKRYWDGAAWTDYVHSPERPYTQPRPSSTVGSDARARSGPATTRPWWRHPWALVGGGLLVLLLMASVAGSPDEASRTGQGEAAVPTVALGAPLTVKGTEYRVLSANTASSVGGEFTSERASGVYLVVDLQLTNRRNDTRMIHGDAIKLVTPAGKMYEPSTDAAIGVEKSIILEEVQPDVPKTGTLVYDVPPDAVAGSKLRVEDLFSDSHGFVTLGL